MAHDPISAARGRTYEETLNMGAYWLLLKPDAQLRHTPYDLTRAAARIRKTNYPQAQDFAEHYVLQPPSEEKMLEAFTRAALR